MSVQTGKFENLGLAYDDGSTSALLAAIARSAEELTSGKGWPEGVNDLLEALGRVTRVSRVWIFQTISLTETHITQNYTFEWAAKPKYKQIGMPMFSMFTNPINREEYRDMIESRKRGEWQKVITSKIENGWLHDNQTVQKIKSMLTIPVMVEDEWWGTLGFDDCEREYDWSDVEIALLRTAGYLISNAVLRDRLSAKRKQFDILKQITDSSAWAYDFRSGNFWCSSDLIYSLPMPMDNIQMSLHAALGWVYPKDRPSLMKAVRQHAADKKDVFRHDLRLFTDCGDIRWVELIGNIRHGESGQAEQFAGIAVDIGNRKQEEERLREEAVTDPLTGTVNRRMFLKRLQEQISLSLDAGTPFSVLMLDIDNFKNLNDTYGHLVGDNMLKHFTKLCFNAIRGDDILSRIGGDEFAILLPGADEVAARNVGMRILHSVAETPCLIEQKAIHLTTSIGLTTHVDTVTTPSKILQKADSALYSAKQQGRNRLIASTDSNCRIQKEHSVA